MALIVGFVTAYPMNWWLVSHHMKHGMVTVRTSVQSDITQAHEGMQKHHTENRDTENSRPMSWATMHVEKASRSKPVWMIMLSILVFALGLIVASTFGGL